MINKDFRPLSLSLSLVYCEMITLRLHYGLVWDLWFYVLPRPIFLGMGKEEERKDSTLQPAEEYFTLITKLSYM